MKNSISKFKQWVFILFCLPFVVLLCILGLIYLPVDCLKYFNSAYYRNTKEKYYLLSGLSSCFKMYNIIDKNRLPIEFYRDTNVKTIISGYFVYKNVMISNDNSFFYDEENKNWLVEQDDDYVIFDETFVQKELARCNDLSGEKKCSCVIFMIEDDCISEIENVQTEFEQCRFKIIKNKDYLLALSDIIEYADNLSTK